MSSPSRNTQNTQNTESDSLQTSTQHRSPVASSPLFFPPSSSPAPIPPSEGAAPRPSGVFRLAGEY